MNNSLLSGAVFVIALIASGWLSKEAGKFRIEDRKSDVGMAYVKRSKMLTAGFDALTADFIWMRTYLRKAPSPQKDASENDKKEISKRAAEMEYAGYTKVVTLDPTFSKAYKFAVLRLMMDLPDNAIMLADQGSAYCKDVSAELDELAAHIAGRIRKDQQQALKYYEKIVAGGAPSKDYLGRQYLRTLVRIKNIDPNSTDPATQADMIAVYDEYRKEKARTAMPGAMPGGMEKGAAGGAPVVESGMMGAMDQSWIRDFVYEKAVDFLESMRNEEIRKKVDAAKIKSVEDIFAALNPPAHLCRSCYKFQLAPGDKFCAKCGTKAATFGICPSDGKVLKGDYCPECGKKPGQGTSI